MDIGVDRDINGGVTTLALTGELDGPRNRLLSTLMKYVADCPTALIIDLSELRPGSDGAIAAFATASQKAMHEHGVPVMLVAAAPEVDRQLAAFRTFVQVYPSHAYAVRALAAWVPRWWREKLLPVPGSVAAARGLVGDACRSWGLVHLRGTAQLVVSELANNAITHTGEEFQVTVAYGRFLRIGVRDHSSTLPRAASNPMFDPVDPRADRGIGLHVVAAYAAHWGSYPVPGGKVVWALLRP